jgi:hypothetical protein
MLYKGILRVRADRLERIGRKVGISQDERMSEFFQLTANKIKALLTRAETQSES